MDWCCLPALDFRDRAKYIVVFPDVGSIAVDGPLCGAGGLHVLLHPSNDRASQRVASCDLSASKLGFC